MNGHQIAKEAVRRKRESDKRDRHVLLTRLTVAVTDAMEAADDGKGECARQALLSAQEYLDALKRGIEDE